MVKWRPNLFKIDQEKASIGSDGRPAQTGRLIGVLVPTIVNSVFAECVEGMEAAAREAGYAIIVTITDDDIDREENAVQTMLARGVSGLLLTVQDANASTTLAALDRKRVPYALVYNQTTDLPRSTIAINTRQAARELIETVIGYGHRTIGMVVQSLQASDRSIRRLEGYRMALKGHAIPSGPTIELPEIDREPEQLSRRLSEALQFSPRPSVLFCASDLLALAVLKGLRKLGLAVPGEISIVGFDGLAIGQTIDPPLAGICPPHREIGATAVNHLIERIDQKAPPTNIVLPHQIRRGGTLGRWTPE